MPTGRVFGKYEVLRRLATGGMGEIFLGRQRGVARFDRLVILKTLLAELAKDEEAVAGFLDEATIVGSINHPNVVGMYEVGEHDGEYVMVMEHIHGMEISQLRRAGVAAKKPIPPLVAAEIVRQAALGLDAAYRAKDTSGTALKIIHRDISPQNIMVRPDGGVKVLDFGVARAELRSTRTQAGQLKGKLGYMSPEQVLTKPLDSRHDQWSLGVVFWELLVGRRLFQADDLVQLLRTIATANVDPPSKRVPTVPAPLDAIVVQMLKNDAAERFPSLGDVARALHTALEACAVTEDVLSSYVQGVAGEQLDAQLKALLSTAPLPAAEQRPAMRACAVCGFEQPVGSRFCASCGKPVAGTESSSLPGSMSIADMSSASRPRPVALSGHPEPEPLSPAAVPAPLLPIEGDLAGSALDDDERTRPVFMEPAPLLPRSADASPGRAAAPAVVPPAPAAPAVAPPPATAAPAPPRHSATTFVAQVRAVEELSEADGAALAALAARHGGAVFRSGHTCAAAFGLDGASPLDADRALAFALDVPGALAPRAAGRVEASVAIAVGEARSSGQVLSGPAFDAARALADVLGAGSLALLESVNQALSRKPRRLRRFPFSGPTGAGAAVELVGGATSQPAPSLVGREDAVRELVATIADVQRRRAGVAVLAGVPGAGKSALLNEMAGLCAWKGVLVARASAALRASSPPLDVVRQLCRSLLVELGSGAASAGTAMADTLDAGLSASGLGAGDRARIRSLLSSVPVAEPTPLAQRASALRASVARLFLGAARRASLCMLIDDAEAIDSASRSILDGLLPRLRGERAVCVLAMRASQVGAPTTVPAAGGDRRIELQPLDDTAVDRLVQDTLGPMAPLVLTWVREAAQGNPRAALGAAGLLAGDGGMVRQGERWEAARASSALDPGVEPIVDALVRRLSLQSRAYLCAVAVAGGAVPDDARVLGAYDEAAGLLLVPRRQGRPSPLSPTVQRALVRSAESTGAAFMCELHEISAARAAQRLSSDAVAPDVVAYHRRFADPHGLAVDHHVAALHRHATLGVLEPLVEVGSYLSSAIARERIPVPAGAAGEPVLDVVAAVLEAQLAMNPPAALAAADELAVLVSRRAPSPGLARIARARAHVLARSERAAETGPALQVALSAAASAYASAVEAAIHIDEGRRLEARGDSAGALRSYEAAVVLDAQSGVGDEAAIWTAPLGVARLATQHGRGSEGRAALEIARGHAAQSPWAATALSMVCAVMAQGDEADKHAAAAAAAADHAGDVVFQVLARTFRARQLATAGHTGPARALLTEAQRLAFDGLYGSGVEAAQRALAALDASAQRPAGAAPA